MNTTSSNTPKTNRHRKFNITSRHIIVAACLLIITGYVLMSGPGSTEQSFRPDIFSARRIVIAPMLCLSGYLLIVWGILKKQHGV